MLLFVKLWNFCRAILQDSLKPPIRQAVSGVDPIRLPAFKYCRQGAIVHDPTWTKVFNSFWFIAIMVLLSAILTSVVSSSPSVVSTLPENPNIRFGIIDMCNEPASLSRVDPKLTGNGTGCTTAGPATTVTMN